jgi:hypothetical protein
MTLTLDEDEILSAAIAGVPRVAEFIATVPAEDRSALWKQRKRATSKPRTLWAIKTLTPKSRPRQ